MWCVKTTFYVSKEAFFWRRTVFGKTDSFSLYIRNLNQNFFGLLATKNGSLAKLPFDVPRGTFWEKHCFTKKKRTFFFFKHWAKQVRKMANFLLRSINSILRDQKSFFGKFSWGSSSYLSISDLSKKIWERLSKLLSMSPDDSFEKKFFFSKNVIFSIIHWFRTFNFETFGQKISCDVSKLHSTSPKKRSFEEEQFLEKPIAFLFIFGHWTETPLTFVGKKCGIVARFGIWAAHRNSSTKSRLLKEKNALVFFRL